MTARSVSRRPLTWRRTWTVNIRIIKERSG
jgi:hypothetical protein